MNEDLIIIIIIEWPVLVCDIDIIDIIIIIIIINGINVVCIINYY